MEARMPKFLRLTRRKKSRIEDGRKPFWAATFLRRPFNYRLLVCLLLSCGIAALVTPQPNVPTYNYRSGDIAKQDIRAPQDFSVEDREATEKRKTEKAQGLLSVYDFNSRAEEEIEKRIAGAFAAMRESVKPKALPEQQRERFQKLMQIQINPDDFNLLKRQGFTKEIEDYLLDLLLPYARLDIVLSREQLFKERNRGILLRDVATREEIVLDDFSALVDLPEVDVRLKRDARKVLKGVRSDLRDVLVIIAQQLIEPTITFNKTETNSRRMLAAQEVSPLYYNIKQGEIIVRVGARISDATLVKLQALEDLQDKKSNRWTLIGYGLLSFLALVIVYRFLLVSLRSSSLTRLQHTDFLFLCTMLIFSFLLFKFCITIGREFSKIYTDIVFDSYFFLVPFACAAIVISVVLSARIAALSAIIISIFTCLLVDSRFEFFMYAFLSSLVAAQEVAQSKERKAIIRAGLIVGSLNGLLVVTLYLVPGNFLHMETAISVGFALLGGLLSAVLALGIIPVIEILFNYTTDIKLLELADLNQPVLRKLLISAPGTYHHSILVGILAEAAAEAIGAHPLLARVSAYYHDIGKINKPLYYVENQKDGENKHDRLLPSMSSLIITKHVKDGVEIARQHRLGRPIQDIILQHHGTSVINYFYQKAKDLQEDGSQPVSDKDFRYPGPKPQTKEAGIVMLADAVQATSKTLSDPAPARIQGMVQRIINSIFVDGQLDECELTLKDLHLIGEHFIRILNGIFHSRIEYPDASEKEANGKGLDKKSTKADEDRPAPDKTDSDRDLGRIGIARLGAKHPASG
jgi:hypothetical protein